MKLTWTSASKTWAAALAVVLCGCAPSIPKSKLASASSAGADDLPADTAESEEKPYAYSPVGKRDPFRDPNLRQGGKDPGPGTSVLQKYDLDQLRLAFTTTATSSPLAMIIDPLNQSHIVYIGDFVGKNWGKISAIKREEITITQIIADPNTGKAYPENIPLRMPNTDRRTDDNYQLHWSAEAGKP